MTTRFKHLTLTLLLMCCIFLFWGCINFRMIKEVDGNDVPPLSDQLQIGVTELEQALEVYGAPSRLIEL